MKPRIVYLIGFMGCGKTTVGKRLANLLQWEFTDLDKRIEAQTGLTVEELFAAGGEEYFRKIEAETLLGLSFNTDTIVAAGGGTPCFTGNMEFMLSTGCTVYLKLTPSQLATRLNTSSNKRPLIQNITAKELQNYIETKLAERSQWYEKAHLTADGFNVNIQLLNKCILLWFGS
ncbi:MAG: shikimate kinase [Bacteroidales bacterium]|jgi:shikimate kinase|nr:shikimate kinase [Bacteroidales bacterium]